MICFLYRFISKGCEFVSNRVPRPGIWGSTSLLIGDELGTPVDRPMVSVEKGGVPRVDRGGEHSCARLSVDKFLYSPDDEDGVFRSCLSQWGLRNPGYVRVS